RVLLSFDQVGSKPSRVAISLPVAVSQSLLRPPAVGVRSSRPSGENQEPRQATAPPPARRRTSPAVSQPQRVTSSPRGVARSLPAGLNCGLPPGRAARSLAAATSINAVSLRGWPCSPLPRNLR